MGRYVFRRLLQFVPTAFLAYFMLHYVTSLGIQLTGNPVRAIFGDKQPPQSLIDAISKQQGLDDPCLQRVGDPCFGLLGERLNKIVNLDFGTNLNLTREVLSFSGSSIIGDALPVTLRLTAMAFAIEALIGITAGILAGLRSGSFADYLVKISTVLFISVPVFVLGIVVRQLVGVEFGNWAEGAGWPDWLANGMVSPTYKADFPFISLIIPAFVLASTSLAITARLTRTSMQENLRADYVRTAKAKGLTQRRVFGIHTLRNSLIPVTTNLGLSLAAYMGGAIITERVFNVPGVGRELARAVRFTDVGVLLGVVTLVVLAYLFTTLIVDLLYAVLDPRIRYE